MNSVLAELREKRGIRIGLAFGLFLVAASLLLDFRDFVGRERAELTRQRADFQRWAAIAQESAWADRAMAAQDARAAAEARLWRAPSRSQAQAIVQEWLLKEMTQAGLGRAQLSSAPQSRSSNSNQEVSVTSDLEGVVTLRLNASFEFSPAAPKKLAEVLAASPGLLELESLSIRRQPVPRVEATLIALIRLAGKAKAVEPRK